MQILEHLVDALHLGLLGELAVTSVKGVDNLTASVKGPGMRGHSLGAVIDHDRIRGGVNGERLAHQVVRHGIAIGIKDHHGGLSGPDRGMDRDIVPWFFGKGPEFLLGK
jgi:hypothetical protein